MPLLLLPLLGDSIKPVLQEKSKVNNPQTNKKSPWKFNQSLVAKPENLKSIAHGDDNNFVWDSYISALSPRMNISDIHCVDNH